MSQVCFFPCAHASVPKSYVILHKITVPRLPYCIEGIPARLNKPTPQNEGQVFSLQGWAKIRSQFPLFTGFATTELEKLRNLMQFYIRFRIKTVLRLPWVGFRFYFLLHLVARAIFNRSRCLRFMKIDYFTCKGWSQISLWILCKPYVIVNFQ